MKDLKLVQVVVVLLLCHSAVAQPRITTQPRNTTVSLAGKAWFSVSATSTSPPVTYQWWFKDAPMDATANPSVGKWVLYLTNAMLADAGSYFAVVSDSSGSVTSKVATLTVDPAFVKMNQPDLVGSAHNELPYWVDLEDDGWLDLVVAVGWGAVEGSPLMVFTNDCAGTLSLTQTHDLSQVSAGFAFIAWADLDNDGDLDGYAAVEPAQSLYFQNEGGGRFTTVRVDSAWTANGTAVGGDVPASADMDNDGFLDLVVGSYDNGTNTVLHGLGGGRFERVRQNAVALTRAYPESLSWADYDDDGYMDLFEATSDGPDQLDLLFHNLGGGRFSRMTTGPFVTVSDISMGPLWGDYDNDGDLDLFVSSLTYTNQLYRNLGNGVFRADQASPVFPAGELRCVGSWGDYDNDGWLDLFLTQSHGSQSRLFHNRGDGTFEEIKTGSLVREATGYGGAWGDYNNDGFLDLCISDPETGVNYLFQNNLRQLSNTNGWLKVKLVGAASNRDGIGATIRAQATIGGKELWQMRQIACQSYQAELLAHFGLGDATRVENLRIRWPSGLVQELHDIFPNQSLRITEHQDGVTDAPNLTASSLASGTIQLTLTGPTNLLYVFETSTNLVQWSKIGVRTNLTGAVDITGTSTLNDTRRFYRGSVP
ncbi:MAG: FG-GAP-like repeat-containing protein [Verrucomicrobiia bacterium]